MPRKTIEQRVTALEADMKILKEHLTQIKTREGIRLGREQLAQGKVVPAREFLETMRKKYKIARV